VVEIRRRRKLDGKPVSRWLSGAARAGIDSLARFGTFFDKNVDPDMNCSTKY